MMPAASIFFCKAPYRDGGLGFIQFQIKFGLYEALKKSNHMNKDSNQNPKVSEFWKKSFLGKNFDPKYIFVRSNQKFMIEKTGNKERIKNFFQLEI